jgi:hypothetical protein
MRPKFVLAMLLLASLALGAVLYLKQHRGQVAAPPASPEIATQATPPPSNVVTRVAPPPAPAPVATNTLTPEQRQAAIDAELDRLQEWCMSDDTASLSNILADLTSPEKEIRDAAIEAAKQFGSTNAIPALKAAAASAQDTEEQIALLEAAQFLSLPSLGASGPDTRTPEEIQVDAQRNAEKNARRQALRQRHTSNQGSQSAPDPSATPPPDSNQSDTPDDQTSPE